jgi:hypothetical protein
VSESTVGIIITVAAVLFSFAIVFLVLRSIGGLTGRIKNGVAGTALVRGFSETGTTISAPSTGPEAPVYKLDLMVSPPTGAPYPVETKQAIPRIVLPFFVPGITVPVDIAPARPDRVRVNWQRFQIGGQGAGMAAGPDSVMEFPSGGGTVDLTFVNGRPVDGVEDVVSAVRSGSMPTTYGSAAELLARGTRGTAVITTAMPLGKRAVDVNPAVDPAVADDPMWLFTLEVTVPGEAPFPAVFGHRVPKVHVARVAPGLALQVAVNLAERNQDVAIDWDALPA